MPSLTASCQYACNINVQQPSKMVPAGKAGIARLLLILATVIVVAGCTSRADLITLREGMDRGTATIRKQHLAWAQALSQGKQSQLPTLTAAELKAVQAAHQEYNDLVTASRTQDNRSVLGGK